MHAVHSEDKQDRHRRRSSWRDRFFGLTEMPGPDANIEGNERKGKWASSGAGLELAVGIGLFGGLGFLGDQSLGTLPWLTVSGALIGMAAGLYLLIQSVREKG